MDWILDPWPWYVSGPLLSLVMLLLIMTGKRFGMSSNLKTICSICGADKVSDFFKFDWRSQQWNLIVVLGVIIGGFISSIFLSSDRRVLLNDKVIFDLKQIGFESAGTTYMPHELFSNDMLSDLKVLSLLIIGGVLVGFGARYASGCTSRHAISGLSNLQIPSLIAIIGFFVGGLIMVHLIFPIIF